MPPPHLILKHLISSVVSLAQLVSPSVALPAELVQTMVGTLHRLRVENPYGRVGGSGNETTLWLHLASKPYILSYIFLVIKWSVNI